MRTSYPRVDEAADGASEGVVPEGLNRPVNPALPAYRGKDGVKSEHRQLPLESIHGPYLILRHRCGCSCGWIGCWVSEPKHAFSAQARHAGRYM